MGKNIAQVQKIFKWLKGLKIWLTHTILWVPPPLNITGLVSLGYLTKPLLICFPPLYQLPGISDTMGMEIFVAVINLQQ